VSDLVYIVRPGDQNEELRYSLRSVARNLPGRRVWIFGHTPPWVRGVESVELAPLEDGFANQLQSLTAAAHHPGLSEDVVLFNDDFYVMEPMDEVRVFHTGTLAGYIAYLESIGKSPTNPWFRGLKVAKRELAEWGIENPLCYEHHSPMPWKRSELRDVIARGKGRPFLYMSYYPATTGPAGERGMDAKSGAAGNPLAAGNPYLSSVDYSFQDSAIGRHVRATFDQPCHFEEPR
jgi:hypothetical protein